MIVSVGCWEVISKEVLFHDAMKMVGIISTFNGSFSIEPNPSGT
jgi:hypothetical protein